MPGDIFGNLSKLPESIMSSYTKELKNMDLKELINKGPGYSFANAGIDVFTKKLKEGISEIAGSGITLTNNAIKDIIKVISSLENTGILLNELFLSFLKPLMTAGLRLFKTALATLSKSVLVPLGLTNNSCRNSYDYSKGYL